MYEQKFVNEWIEHVYVCEQTINSYCKCIRKHKEIGVELESLLLLKVITLIDLATLDGDDTVSNVSALVRKALSPIPHDVEKTLLVYLKSWMDDRKVLRKVRITRIDPDETSTDFVVGIVVDNEKPSYEYDYDFKKIINCLKLTTGDSAEWLNSFLNLDNKEEDYKLGRCSIKVASVCVYPNRVNDANRIINKRRISISKDGESFRTLTKTVPITSVAAGFPSGQYSLSSKVEEIKFALSNGAREIDVVIDRSLVLGQKWKKLYEEIIVLREACGDALMKTILSVGECGGLKNIYKASMVVMMAGSDYVKTSTGKEATNATYQDGVVICRAIRDFFLYTGRKVGFKPAGGIRTVDDGINWLCLVLYELGPDWLPLFRIGASSVIANIERKLQKNVKSLM